MFQTTKSFLIILFAYWILFASSVMAEDGVFLHFVSGKVVEQEWVLHLAIQSGDLRGVKAAIKEMDLQDYSNLDGYVLKSNNAEVIQYMREVAKLNISDLQIAATTNDVTTAAKLISLMQKTPSTSLGSVHPLSPLRLAIYKGHVEVLKLMLERGVSINDNPGMLYLYYGQDQTTLLKQAIAKGNPKIVKLLLEAGAKIEKPSDYYIPTAPKVAIGDLYKELNLNYSSPPDAWKAGTQKLLNQGKIKKVASESSNKYCPLVKAIWAGRESVVAVLLDAGANPNILIGGENRPLHVAVKSGHVGIVKRLIEAGANVNTPNVKGRTPLDLAYYSCGDIADLLRKAGAIEPGSQKQKPKFRKPAEKEKPEPIPTLRH